MNSTLDAVMERPATAPYSAKRMAKPVNFYCRARPDAESVRLVGDFNDWDLTSLPMQRQPDGCWFVQVPLTHGHHQYLFLVDGELELDPDAAGIVRVDTFGKASVIAVSRRKGERNFPMSYFINPVGEDRCVFLSYEGETPAVELSAARYEADAVLDQHRWHRLVVDVTQLQSVPTALEFFDFASGLSSSIDRARRVALVVRPEQERHARLVQEVARRGRVFLTYFLDPDKAALWVKQSPGRQIMGRNRKEKP